jgi:4'-phosphopantetheinyl transferase
VNNKKNLIWIVSIDENLEKNYLSFISILSRDEIHRYHRYKDKKAQYTFLVSHISLRLILAKYCNLHPKKLEFEIKEHGKPYLKGRDELQFNLSHSIKKACVIISDTEVGIDVECIRNFNYEEIMTFFSDDESLVIYQQQNKKEKLINFFRIWTQKESLLKCIGTGLVENIKDINIDYINKIKEEKIYLETILSKNKKYILSFSYKSPEKRTFCIKKFNLVNFLSF